MNPEHSPRTNQERIHTLESEIAFLAYCLGLKVKDINRTHDLQRTKQRELQELLGDSDEL